jgi:hypothetical protein
MSTTLPVRYDRRVLALVALRLAVEAVRLSVLSDASSSPLLPALASADAAAGGGASGSLSAGVECRPEVEDEVEEGEEVEDGEMREAEVGVGFRDVRDRPVDDGLGLGLGLGLPDDHGEVPVVDDWGAVRAFVERPFVGDVAGRRVSLFEMDVFEDRQEGLVGEEELLSECSTYFF